MGVETSQVEGAAVKDLEALLCIIGTATAIMVGLIAGVYITMKCIELFIASIV